MKNMRRIVAATLALSMLCAVAGCSKKEKKITFEPVKAKNVAKFLKNDMDLDEVSWSNYYGNIGEYMDTDTDYSCFDASGDYKRVVAGRCEENTTVIFYEFDDVEDAHDYFEDYIFDVYSDIEEDDEYDGSIVMDLDDEIGYVLVDAEVEDADDYVMGDRTYTNHDPYGFEYTYGGVYFCDNMVLIVFNYEDGDDDQKEEVDTILEGLDLPTP